MTSVNEVITIKKNCESDLLKLPGVTGVDVGYKITKGEKTKQISIRVLVKEKKDVPKEQMVSKSINGIPTDVIQRTFKPAREMVKQTEFKARADTNRYDPLKGGISIGPARNINNYIFVGTLGTRVRDRTTGRNMLLSNWHVMCVDNNWQVGDDILQPSLIDGGNASDVGGELQRATLGGTVDCAVSDIRNRTSRCNIVNIGDVNGTATATLNMQVRKRGRTTGLTYGTVDSVSLTAIVDYDDPNIPITGVGAVTFQNQIGIDYDSNRSSNFGIGGDSGSVVVNDSKQVVGLFFASNVEERDSQGNVITPEGVYGVANPIQDVLNTLNVDVCAPRVSAAEKVDENFSWHRWKNIKYLMDTNFEIPWKKDKRAEKLEVAENRFWGGFDPFINEELRPDLRKGALVNEPDYEGSEEES